MLANLPVLSADPLWALNAEFNRDPRPEKIDLIIGVYRDETGRTPNFRSVLAAELELAAQDSSKVYGPLSGNPAFNDGMARLMLGDDPATLRRQHTIQAVGGTGALRILADFVAAARPHATVWISDPGYVNHQPIFQAARLSTAVYGWHAGGAGFDVERACADLKAARAGDVVVLHGCCHNPTGIDPDPSDWRELAGFCARQGLVPLVDFAYQGFGDGIDADAAGLRILVETQEVVLIASSCSKNMGLYCERVGSASVVGPDAAAIAPVGAVLERGCRSNYSMPSSHGALVAARLLASPRDWLDELETMRRRIVDIRHRLCDALRAAGAPEGMQAMRGHRGLFSMLPLSPGQMRRLCDDFAIYGTQTGRLNLAGLKTGEIERVAAAIAQVAASRA